MSSWCDLPLMLMYQLSEHRVKLVQFSTWLPLSTSVFSISVTIPFAMDTYKGPREREHLFLKGGSPMSQLLVRMFLLVFEDF